MYAKLNPTGDWRFFDDNGTLTYDYPETMTVEYYIMYGVTYYSSGEVKRIVRKIARPLGKTQKALLEEIGKPDRIAPNPRFTERYPMQLYQCDRIDALIPF